MKKPLSSLYLSNNTQKLQKQLTCLDHSHYEAETKIKMEQEKYFYTSSSDDDDDFKNSKQEIVEKTADNAFGRFEELLGSGAFKRVYKGYDFNAGREIAWSVINVESSTNHNFEKITEEINILKQLNHPNIIHFISGWYDENKKQVIIITEMVSGGSLKENLKRIKEPRLRLVKKWIKQTLGGLDYLHKKNIIHRDLKCDNIFLDNFFGNVKIGDLGGSELLCKKYGKNFAGTEEFMAPEVVEGKYTVKADIYSLGMSIIEMLTLEKPYKECDVPMAIYYNITHGIYPESLSKISNEKMVNFIKLCLKRENERPSARELLLNNTFLNDETSDDNNYPIKINNQLRQNNFSNKLQNEIKPMLFMGKPAPGQQEFASMVNSNKISNLSSIQKETNFDMNKAAISEINNKTLNNGHISQIMNELNKTSINKQKEKLNLSKDESPMVSPKNYINPKVKKSSSSFVISIKDKETFEKENNQNNSKLSNSTKSVNHLNNSEVEISFLVQKDEWKNKKLLKCPYNLEIDTVDGLASELQKAINLNDEDYQIVRNKLNESLTKYNSTSTCSSQRNTISSLSSDIKQKCKCEEFFNAYNSLTDTIKSLLYNDSTKKLVELVNGVKNKTQLSSVIQQKFDNFKKKEKYLLSITTQTLVSNVK